jgi:excisionase family DNA binding protein
MRAKSACDQDPWVTVSDVARRLDVVPERVRQLADRGALPTVRTLSGQRLFRLSDVKRLADERGRGRRR